MLLYDDVDYMRRRILYIIRFDEEYMLLYDDVDYITCDDVHYILFDQEYMLLYDDVDYMRRRTLYIIRPRIHAIIRRCRLYATTYIIYYSTKNTCYYTTM